MEWLLAHGANPNATTAQSGSTALHLCIVSAAPQVREVLPQMVAALLNAGIRVGQQNRNRATALHLARAVKSNVHNAPQALRTLEGAGLLC